MTLEEKLDHQFHRYAEAQTRLRQAWCETCEQGISRAEWETWLAGPGDEALTSADLAQYVRGSANASRQPRPGQ